MGRVYESAYINLAATAAADRTTSGLFKTINVETTIPFRLATMNNGRVTKHYAWNPMSVQHAVSISSLRGWVLQEHPLSMRTIYFGPILSWECAQLGTTEMFPGGLPNMNENELRAEYWGGQSPFRLTTLLKASSQDGSVPDRGEIYGRWLDCSSESFEMSADTRR
jgi:hypothetical protein